MATIAEFYSQNLAAEVRKGLLQKVRLGGTPTRAPLGYLNVIERHEGRDIRTVIVDPERAPHIVWMFEAYATGDYLDPGAGRGSGRARSDRPARRPSAPRAPRSRCRWSSACWPTRTTPGSSSSRACEYPGRHEPLISEELFERGSGPEALSRRLSKEKPYQHPHYLKGTAGLRPVRGATGGHQDHEPPRPEVRLLLLPGPTEEALGLLPDLRLDGDRRGPGGGAVALGGPTGDDP